MGAVVFVMRSTAGYVVVLLGRRMRCLYGFGLFLFRFSIPLRALCGVLGSEGNT